jgi:adenine-specific DNA methylase
MDKIVEKLVERIKTPSILKETSKEQLKQAIEMLEKEIAMNESCNMRTEENDGELRRLYDAKCRCRQRMSIL